MTYCSVYDRAGRCGGLGPLIWLVMTVLSLPMAIVMGSLSSRYPDAGGVSTFVRRAFGERLAAVTGWLFFASVPVGAPIAALTAAGYVGTAFNLNSYGQHVLAAAIVAWALLNNYFGVRFLGRAQVLITVAILALLAVAVAVAAPHVSAVGFTPFVAQGWLGAGQAAALMFWCFIGWEAVSHLAEEFADPQRDTMRAVLVSAAVVGVLYLGVAAVTVGTGAYGDGISGGSLAYIMQRFTGPVGSWITACLAVFVCLGTVNAYVGAASRVAYSLAREGAGPAGLARLHPKHKTPVAGLVILAISAAIVVLLSAVGDVGLHLLLPFPNATFIATYIVGSAAAVRLFEGEARPRRLALLSLFISVAVYAFLGWAALYPPVIAAVVWLWMNRTKGGEERTLRAS